MFVTQYLLKQTRAKVDFEIDRIMENGIANQEKYMCPRVMCNKKSYLPYLGIIVTFIAHVSKKSLKFEQMIFSQHREHPSFYIILYMLAPYVKYCTITSYVGAETIYILCSWCWTWLRVGVVQQMWPVPLYGQYKLSTECHFHIWQVLSQYSYGAICKIWMWLVEIWS